MSGFKIFAVLLCFFNWRAMAENPPAAAVPTTAPNYRVASVFLAESFINEQLALHIKKSELIKDLKMVLEPDTDQIFLRGKLQVPIEELKAVNLDPELGAFRFQVDVKFKVTHKGYLVMDFPLSKTFFYPANSKNLKRDKVIIPVQMLSLALASARGYLSALSGDFSSFDRRTKKIKALVSALDGAIAKEKNADALDELKNQRAALELQLAAVPIERKQLGYVAKQVSHLLGFTSEKELNLNEELAARKNALVLKLNVSQLAPFLRGVQLGGVRVLHDKKDGGGENYIAIDMNSLVAEVPGSKPPGPPADRVGMKIAPVLIMKIRESLFESEAVLAAEKKSMGSKLRNMKFALKDDGMHVSGEWHSFFVSIPFDTVVDFVSTGTDVFEVRVRDVAVAGIDLEFMTSFVLKAMENRLDTALKGICDFTYVGTERDHSRALRVAVDPKALVPAFPDLHLLSVDVRHGEFLLKSGGLRRFTLKKI